MEYLFLIIILMSVGCSKTDTAITSDTCGYDENSTTYVKICTIKASPTELEMIELRNYDSQAYTLANWKLCDKNAYDNGMSGCKSLSSTVINAKSSVALQGLPFGINDTGETIYLINESNQIVHSRSN